MNEKMWTIVSALAGAAAATASRRLLQKLSPDSSTLNPADRRVTWREGLMWAVVTGVGAGVARLVSQRVAAAGWEKAVGASPPGVKTG